MIRSTSRPTRRPTNTARQIVGVGELILDHVWDIGDGAGEGRLFGSRGGGSVLNVLANLAQLGWDASAAGVVGNDEAGAYARADLDMLAVDTSNVVAATRRRTRLIFELLGVENATQVGGSAHSFTTKCPVCAQRIADAARPTMRIPEISPGARGWALYDQITAPRVVHAQTARSAGLRTVLDLGAVSYLRYQPTARILAHLRDFDLVFLNGKVAASLARRAEVADVDLAKFLPDSVLVITQGRHGALVTSQGGFRHRVPAPHTQLIVDDSGAGDALCAHTLDWLASAVDTSRTTPLDPRAVVDAVTDAESYVSDVLGRVGARGHLPPPPGHNRFESLRNRGLADMQMQSWRERMCVLCDLPLEEPPRPLTLIAGSNALAEGARDDETTPPVEPTEQLSEGRAAPSGRNPDTKLAFDSDVGLRESSSPAGSYDPYPDLDPGIGANVRPGFDSVKLPGRPRRAPKTGAARNTSLLPDRMLTAAGQTDAVAVARSVLRGHRSSIHVVGSGGSLPAASYISQLLNREGHFAFALTPGDYMADSAVADVVILVSYSGSTRDLGAVAEEAKRRDVRQIVLLTGSRTPTIAASLRPMTTDAVLTYAPAERRPGERGVRERGFVSITGTVAPCVPWLAAAAGMQVVVDMVNRLDGARSAAKRAAWSLSGPARAAGRLHVVYGPGGRPAALDIESKFMESALPSVSLHEQKDLSHGRFVTVLQPTAGSGETMAPVVMLSCGKITRYQSALLRSLSRAGVPHEWLRSEVDDESGSLELLTAVQTFSQQVGTDLGTDISRPRSIPSEGLRLYKWRGPLP